MRRLFAIGLTVCVVGSAAAQTEVIIRRPGEKDQVIHLDSVHAREALAQAKVELQAATGALQQRMKEVEGKLGELRLNGEPLRLNTLAFRNGDLAAESLVAPLMKKFTAIMRQPHLGVTVSTVPRESDKFGAYVEAVTPGSPADKAGIMSGDIIVRIAGKSLTERSPKDDSGPGVRLVSIIGTLTVGKPVEVELRRGTQNKMAKVTPDEGEASAIARMAPSVTELSRLPLERLNQAWALPTRQPWTTEWSTDASPFNVFSNGNDAFSFSFGNSGLFASYELAPLNPKLGAYFGATEGVLVVNNRALDEVSVTTSAAPAAPSRAIPARRIKIVDTNVAVAPRAGMVSRLGADSAARAGGMACDSSSTMGSMTVRCRGTGGAAITYIDGAPGQSGFVSRKAINIGLEPGDVIVSVDDRKVTNPGQLMRIVGSYDHNDEFKLHILRQKHAETLTVKMP